MLLSRLLRVDFLLFTSLRVHLFLTQRGMKGKTSQFNTKSTRSKKVELANSVDPDEVAHIEPPQLNLHCLHSCPQFLNMIEFD